MSALLEVTTERHTNAEHNFTDPNLVCTLSPLSPISHVSVVNQDDDIWCAEEGMIVMLLNVRSLYIPL